MPEYRYWATTEIGDTVTGKLNASSPDEAAHLLTLRGFVVQRLDDEAAARPPDAATAVSPPADIPMANFLEADAAGSQAAAVPLSVSLRALAQETSGSLRRTIRKMIGDLDRGLPVDAVMRQFPMALPQRMSALVDAGLKTGKLPFFMQHVLDYQRRQIQLRRRIIRNLAYPFLICLCAVAIVTGILAGIVPSFKKIFDDFGTELPGLTLALVALSDSIVYVASFLTPVADRLGWPLTILLLLLSLIAGAVLICTAQWSPFRRIRHWSQGGLQLVPIVGSVFQTASFSNFLRLLAMLVEAGVPLPESLRLASTVTDDARLDTGTKRVADSIEQGESPLDAVRQAEILPREVLPIFRWADNRKLFVDALRGAAEIYATRSNLHAGVTGVILAPAVILSVGLSVGLVVVAMFLPLIKLLNDLS